MKPTLTEITRRDFLTATGSAALAAGYHRATAASGRIERLLAQRAVAPDLPLPPKKRLAFGWPAWAVPSDKGAAAELHWSPRRAVNQSAWLRLTVALDDREEKRIEAFLLRSGRALGEFDVRYACVFQPFELALDGAAVRAAIAEGIGLRMTRGSGPLWLFQAASDSSSVPAALRPHLLWAGSNDPLDAFHAQLLSLSSVTQFGWMEGCVLDGLWALTQRGAPRALQSRARTVLNQHLELFFAGDKLRYENHHSEPADGKISGIEATLPFAALAATRPAHPALELAINFWQARRETDGAVRDAGVFSTEGCYTVAWPMAALARQRNDAALAQLALAQLRLRRARLVSDEAILQNAHDDGRQGGKNWARGVAWYFLGLTRTLIALDGARGLDEASRAEWRAECRRMAAWVLARRSDAALWPCFIDDPSTGSETSGSAGIATALALGAQHGLLPPSARVAAAQTFAALQKHLTSDGFLTGVAQANKGGAWLQRNGYRVIAQFGMGLLAQLEAALRA